MKIFNELTGGPVGAATVAKNKGWKKDMTSRLLNGLVAMELVNKTKVGKKEGEGHSTLCTPSTKHEQWEL